MAYHVPIRTIPFEFRDGDLKGLVVEFRANIPLDDYFDLVEAAARAGKAKGLEPLRDLLRHVAAVGLVSWNLENGAGPVEPTAENFTGHLPPLLGVTLVNRYLSEIGGSVRPFSHDIRKWVHVGKAPGVEAPVELMKALIVDRIARRYGLPPHEVAQYDADFYLRHLAILDEAKRGDD